MKSKMPQPGDVFATLSWRQFETPIRGGSFGKVEDHLAPGGTYAVMMLVGFVPREARLDKNLAALGIAELGFVPGERHAELREIASQAAALVSDLTDALDGIANPDTGPNADGLNAETGPPSEIEMAARLARARAVVDRVRNMQRTAERAREAAEGPGSLDEATLRPALFAGSGG
jgi:hypothetical protein